MIHCEISRRQLLLWAVLPCIQYLTHKIEFKPKTTKEKIARELVVFAEFWRQTFDISPGAYIDLASSTRNLPVRQLIHDDFRKSRVLKVRGLMLSKFEVFGLIELLFF